MQGSIAQTLSLAAHGNAYLGGKLEDDYFPNHQTFAFCQYVKQTLALARRHQRTSSS